MNMLRTSGALLLSLGLIMPAGGCANIQNDGTRTRTEGTLVGVGAGAGVGALLGQIIGQDTKGTLIGAGIGALLGGLSGFMVGDHVADKKAQYASQEAWLDACIADAHKNNTELAQYNAQLGKEIADLDKKSRTLAAEYKKNKQNKDKLVAEKKAIDEQRKDLGDAIAALETRLQKDRSVANDARASKNTKEAAAMDKEIAQLEKQIAQMKDYNRKLANISVRMAV